MKKLLAIVVSATILVSFSAISFAQAGKSVLPASKERMVQQKMTDRLLGIQERNEAFKAAREEFTEMKKNAPLTREEFKTIREEFNALRGEIMMSRAQALKNKAENNLIRVQNMKLRADMRAALASLRDQEIEISDETKEAIKEYTDQIRLIREEMQATSGNIGDLMKSYREAIKARDYISMDIIFAEISAVQNFRNNSLQDINEILMTVLQLLVAEA